MAKQNKSFPILTTFLVCLVALTVFIGIKDQRAINGYDTSTKGARTETVQTNNKTRHLTRQKAINYYKKEAPNITEVEKNNSKKVHQGFTLACTKLHSNKAVSKYSPKIKQDLGNKAGSILISDTKPTQLVASNIQQSQKMLSYQQGFGKFNDGIRVIPMTVLVSYRTSKYLNGSGDTAGMHKANHIYYDAFHFNIHIRQNNSSYLTLTSHTRSQNNSND